LPPPQVIYRLFPPTETLLRQAKTAKHVRVGRREPQPFVVLLDRAGRIDRYPPVIVAQRDEALGAIGDERDRSLRSRARLVGPGWR